QPVDVGVGHPLLAHDRPEAADAVEAARRVQVVEDRLVAAEALVAEDLLDEQPPVPVLPAPELGVALGRDLSEGHVAHGGSLLRRPTGCRAWPARARSPRTAP